MPSNSSHSVVIDNDALVNLFALHTAQNKLFNLLQNLFSQILIPMEVKNEFLKIGESQKTELRKRTEFINSLSLNKGFISLCNRFDSINLIFLQTCKGIHAGEREVAAQQKRTGARYILSDDSTFSRELKAFDGSVTVLNSLHLMAFIDFHQLSETQALKKSLHEIRRFREGQIRDAYQEISKLLGLSIGPKRLKDFTSFKKLDIT